MTRVLVRPDKYRASSSRPNPEDRINRKPDDQKNDQTIEKAKNHKTKSTVWP